MKFWNLAKLEREYLTLDRSYAKGCDRLQEYLAHRQPNPNSQEEASIDSICKDWLKLSEDDKNSKISP